MLADPPPGTARIVQARGYAWHTVEWGQPSDPPLLLVHGVTSSSETFWRVGPCLAADRRRVVAVDLPGHGRTGGWRGRHRWIQTAARSVRTRPLRRRPGPRRRRGLRLRPRGSASAGWRGAVATPDAPARQGRFRIPPAYPERDTEVGRSNTRRCSHPSSRDFQTPDRGPPGAPIVNRTALSAIRANYGPRRSAGANCD